MPQTKGHDYTIHPPVCQRPSEHLTRRSASSWTRRAAYPNGTWQHGATRHPTHTQASFDSPQIASSSAGTTRSKSVPRPTLRLLTRFGSITKRNRRLRSSFTVCATFPSGRLLLVGWHFPLATLNTRTQHQETGFGLFLCLSFPRFRTGYELSCCFRLIYFIVPEFNNKRIASFAEPLTTWNSSSPISARQPA